jgi:L-asparaginase / beta-aspartyl-peptidase
MNLKNNSFLLLLLLVLFCACNKNIVSNKEVSKPISIIIHGGAGNFKESDMTPVARKEYENTLRLAIDTAYQVLEKGGSAVDAVELAIIVMEDSPLFNAGRGSVFNAEGKIEMEASIMDGSNRKAGAVTNVQLVKNPISLCKHIMLNADQFYLSGEGALAYAKKNGLKIETKEYFETESRWKKYEKAKKKNASELDHDEKMGTVGAVAMDKNGNIAAGTSTGGLNFKKFGRIADSSIIGAGTFADNTTCAISCTGLGEYFIRTSAAHEVSAQIKYKKVSLKDAMHDVLFEQIKPMKGRGGMIGIDSQGNVAAEFTTTGMYRAWKTSTGKSEVKIF